MVDNIGSSCRTCMKSDSTMVNLFQSSVDNPDVELADMLMYCTGTMVSVEDGLPQKICSDCQKFLEISYTFRKQAITSENELKKLIELEAQVKLELDEKPQLEDGFDDFSFDDIPMLNEVKDEICDKLFKCDLCNKQFTKESKYLKHIVKHNSLTCMICGKSYRTKAWLDKHMEKHANPTLCNICGLTLDDEKSLLEHTITHSDSIKNENTSDIKIEDRYPCTECDDVFSEPKYLLMHKKKHLNAKNKRFICDVCNKKFSVKSMLERHLRLHSGEQPFKCMQCPKKYSRQDQLTYHMKRHNGHKPNACPHCDKTFTQLCSLKDHIRTHTGETPYLCSQCGKGFANASNLRQHIQRHSGVKPFPCKLCPKSFCTKGQMSAHLSTHSGAHPYACETCGAAFTKSFSLKKHTLIHTGVRPYACGTCNMRFTCKDHLKRHSRIHTGEKPYRCKYCERAFTQSNDLAKHLRTHVGVNLYQCTVCDMRFRLSSELKAHYPSHYLPDTPHGTTNTPNGTTNTPNTQNVPQPITLAVKPDDSLDGRITITFTNNMLDKNGLAGDITINIEPEKS